MLCQHCNQNEATVSLHISINGQEQALRLCPQCAASLEAHYFGPMPAMLRPFGGFGRTPVPAAARPPATRPEISGTLDPGLARRREQTALKARLDAAVKSENYEEAIRLRDRLKGLDNPQ